MNPLSNSVQLFLENFIQELELNNIPYKHTNDDLIILCPFCLNRDNKYKLKLYINKQNLLYHCFRCGVKGNIFSFHRILKELNFKGLYKEFINQDFDELKSVYTNQIQNKRSLQFLRDFIEYLTKFKNDIAYSEYVLKNIIDTRFLKNPDIQERFGFQNFFGVFNKTCSIKTYSANLHVRYILQRLNFIPYKLNRIDDDYIYVNLCTGKNDFACDEVRYGKMILNKQFYLFQVNNLYTNFEFRTFYKNLNTKSIKIKTIDLLNKSDEFRSAFSSDELQEIRNALIYLNKIPSFYPLVIRNRKDSNTYDVYVFEGVFDMLSGYLSYITSSEKSKNNVILINASGVLNFYMVFYNLIYFYIIHEMVFNNLTFIFDNDVSNKFIEKFYMDINTFKKIEEVRSVINTITVYKPIFPYAKDYNDIFLSHSQ
ncbi:MAG: CHC2 zinc finger domain-containing protein [Nanopusillaceae archaeon]